MFIICSYSNNNSRASSAPIIITIIFASSVQVPDVLYLMIAREDLRIPSGEMLPKNNSLGDSSSLMEYFVVFLIATKWLYDYAMSSMLLLFRSSTKAKVAAAAVAEEQRPYEIKWILILYLARSLTLRHTAPSQSIHCLLLLPFDEIKNHRHFVAPHFFSGSSKSERSSKPFYTTWEFPHVHFYYIAQNLIHRSVATAVSFLVAVALSFGSSAVVKVARISIQIHINCTVTLWIHSTPFGWSLTLQRISIKLYLLYYSQYTRVVNEIRDSSSVVNPTPLNLHKLPIPMDQVHTPDTSPNRQYLNYYY